MPTLCTQLLVGFRCRRIRSDISERATVFGNPPTAPLCRREPQVPLLPAQPGQLLCPEAAPSGGLEPFFTCLDRIGASEEKYPMIFTCKIYKPVLNCMELLIYSATEGKKIVLQMKMLSKSLLLQCTASEFPCYLTSSGQFQ